MAEAYKVLRITELTRVSDTQGVEKYYRHTIKTRGGSVISVDVPEADFNAKKVAPILNERAIEADKILAL